MVKPSYGRAAQKPSGKSKLQIPVGEVRCRRLVIEDDAGRERIVLSVGQKEGHAGIGLFDGEGNMVIHIEARSDGFASVHVRSPDHSTDCIVAVDPTWTTESGKGLAYFMAQHDDDISCCATLGASSSGDAHLQLNQADGGDVTFTGKVVVK